MKDLVNLVMSCDHYSDCWTPYMETMKRFWPDFPFDTVVCTETKQGTMFSKTINSPAKTWSGRLLDACGQITSDYVFFTLEDFWLCEPVDTARFEYCLQALQNDPQIGAIYLDEPALASFPLYQDQLFEILPKMPYRISAGPGLWNRQFLLSVLREEESAWDFERIGSYRECGYQKKVMTVSPRVFGRITPAGAVQKGKWERSLKKRMKKINLSVDESTRSRQTGYDHIKTQAKGIIYHMNPSLILKVQNWLYARRHNRR